MADSTQAAAGTPAEVVKQLAAIESARMTYITVNVSSYAVGGFPRVDAPPEVPDETSSFKKFFESVIGYETGTIMSVELVKGAVVVARYDDTLDRIKLWQVDDETGLLSEVANAANPGDLRLRVWHN